MPFTVSPSELLVAMLVVLAAVALFAERIKIAYPILLTVAGCVLGVVPTFEPALRIAVDPDTVFFIFLPPLLYYGALQTTWRDFKANFSQISSLAIGLVLATMVAVALVALWVLPGITVAEAFLLGAIVSPPDAVSATAVLSKVAVPKRVVTILEGESLANDATALVAYKTALGAILVGAFSLAGASVGVFVAAVGGIAVGLVAAWLLARLMRRVDVPAVESVLSLLVPYAAYIPADKLGASGVLAAVAAGIYMGRQLPRLGTPQQRLRTLAVWDSLVFLLNGMIFILIGLELSQVIERGLLNRSAVELAVASAAVAATCIAVRMLWVFPTLHLPAWLGRPARHGDASTDDRPDWRESTVVAWAGMRGIVTLAAALAVPKEVAYRDPILFIAFAIILVTLVGQGLTLAPLVRLLGLKDDDARLDREERLARLDAAHAAISRLAVLSLEDTFNPQLIDRVRADYDQRIARLGGQPGTGAAGPADDDEALRRIQLIALDAERRMVTFLRDENLVGDAVLRRLLVEIDLAEAKLRTQQTQPDRP